jgi:hypothetical protein
MEKQKKIALFISVLLHPLLMPFLGLVIILKADTYISFIEPRLMLKILLFIFILTVILPLSFIPFYLYARVVRKVEMNSTKERVIPYFLTFILFYIAHFIVKKLPLNDIYSLFLFAVSVSVLVMSIITYFWKISAHMVGVGGVTGLVISLSLRYGANFMVILVIVIILAGITAYSRLVLASHKPSQVYSGFALGFFIISFFCLFF